MDWLTKELEEMNWSLITIDIDNFVTCVEWFRITAPGVYDDVEIISEMNAESHKHAARDILKTLRGIKNFDIGAYKTIVHLYK